MDKTSARNAARRLHEPTAASVLGIKGQLRFHPHGSTQKAHVVLRQVDLAEDSEEEGDPSMIYFSLFAQKRIEVKPGKEILLAVATPDGKLLDTPVVFAGRLSGDDNEPSAATLHMNGVQPVFARPQGTLPPKMRKTWSKRNQVQPPSKPASSQSYASVGIQAGISEETEVLTELSPSPVEDEDSLQRDRSLSPMELDSAPSSPAPASPVPLPELSRSPSARTKSTSFSPPGLWVSTSPPQSQDLVSEEHIPSFNLSPDNDEPPGLSFTPVPDAAKQNGPKSPVASPVTATAKDAPKLPETVPSTQPLSVQTPGIIQTAPAPVASPSPASESALLGVTPATARYVPKRKLVHNPFVSGGLLTDFVSASAAKKGEIEPKTGPVSDAKANSQSQVSTPQPPANSPAPAPSPPAVPSLSGENVNNGDPTTLPAFKSPRRSRTPESSSSPSSSKVKVEDIPLSGQSAQTSAAPPRQMPSSYLPPHVPFPFMPPRYPPMMMPNFPPNLAHPPPHLAARPLNGAATIPSSAGPTVTTAPKHNTPPPAYVPTNSYSNPLNIRPATNIYAWSNDRYVPTSPTLALPPSSTTVPKKPLPIGSGWPHNRQANGNATKNGRRSSLKAPVASPTTPVPPAQTATPFPSSAAPTAPNVSDAPDPSILTPKPEDESPPPQYQAGVAELLAQLRSTEHESPSPAPLASPTPPPLSHLETSVVSANSSRPPSATQASHPLPPRPPAFSGQVAGVWNPHTGIKRMGSPGLQSQSPDARRTRTFNWPTSEAIFTLRLQGDDDVGIRNICHNSDGSLCAVTCYDKSVRILSTKTRTELAKLAHNMQVTAIAWMDRDAGIITLGDNGIVSTWTRSAGNKWQWAKILDASGDRRAEDEPCCLAFGRDRIAIAFPKAGVKVWLFIKGTWLPQRSILRQNVTAIKFVEENEALIGGTTDGVLWYCQVPNGTLRAYSFMKSKVYALDVDPKGTHALVAQTGGRSVLVSIAQDDQKGTTERSYAVKDGELQSTVVYDFGALFASRGRCLLFGVTRGCILVWDRKSGEIIHGLNHGEDNLIQAVSCFEGSQAAEGHILTGTRQGHLTWFSQPVVDGNEGRGTW